MTREEAARIINECKDKGFKHTFYTLNEYHTALDMAIKALEQQPCEDAISRKAAIDALTKTSGIRGDALKALYDLSPVKVVTPRPKIGHWVRQTDDYHDYYECEHCGIAVGLDDIKNYCPNCGAKMEVIANDRK